MLSATSTDLASCPRCTGPVRLTLASFRRDVEGSPLGAFLAHHLEVYRREELRTALRDARRSLPPQLEVRVDAWAGQLLREAEAHDLWDADTALVLDAVVATGAAVAGEARIGVGDAEMLDLFEAVALDTVLALDDRAALRERLVETERAGRRRLRWAAAAAAAGVLLLVWQPAAFTEPLAWTLLGLGVLPPAARWVRARAEG